MDKYEYQVHADEIKKLIGEHRYAEAMNIADGIDWRKVRSVSMLQTVSEIYKINKKYEEAREILLLAYDRYPSRNIVYALCELAIKLNDVVQAKLLYEEFISLAPSDTSRYILLYKLYEALDVSIEERIELLEEFKQKDYTERWAYELALLYHKIGQETKCVEACDELILWFGEGKYVKKAMELKMKHTRLSKEQQLKYEGRQEPIPMTDKFMSMNSNTSRQLYDTDPQSGNLQQIPMTPYSQNYQQRGGIVNPENDGSLVIQRQSAFDNKPGMNTPIPDMKIFGQEQSSDMSMSVSGLPMDMNTPVSDLESGMDPINNTGEPNSGMMQAETPVMQLSAEPVRNDLLHTTQMLTTSEIDKIEIKPVNMGMYNTIDLQNGLSENIKKFFENEKKAAADSGNAQYDPYSSYEEPVSYENAGSDTDGNIKNDIELTDSNGPVISLKSFSPADNELDEVPGNEEDVQITTFMPGYGSQNAYTGDIADDEQEDEDDPLYVAADNTENDTEKAVNEDNAGITEDEAVDEAEESDPELKSIYEDWENRKRENEERRIQEAKVLSLQQTADIMAQLKGVLPDIDDIAKPTPPRGIPNYTPYFTMPEEAADPETDDKGLLQDNDKEAEAGGYDRYEAGYAYNNEWDYDEGINGGSEIDFAKKEDIVESEEVKEDSLNEEEAEGGAEPVAEEESILNEEEPEYSEEVPAEEENIINEEEPEYSEEVPAEEENIINEEEPEYSEEVPAEEETIINEEEPEDGEEVPAEEESIINDEESEDIEDAENEENEEIAETTDSVWGETLPEREISYELEVEDDSWTEEEARGKTEEMPVSEIVYESETDHIDIKSINESSDDNNETEISDNNELYFREIMNIEDPEDDEETDLSDADDEDETLSYTEDEEAARREAFEVTSELPEYPYKELDDYGEVEEMVMIEQPDGLDGIMKTDDMPVDAIARANYEAGMEFDLEGIEEHKRTGGDKNNKISIRNRPGYMKLETTTGSKREFDEEEKLVFGRFQDIEWLKSQIVEALDDAGMESSRGNVIVMGDEPTGRKAIAVDIVKVMRATEVRFKGKVAKISGEALNKKDIPLTIKKLRQGALIVENAQDLTPSSARLVAEALELESEPVLVILEGDKKGMSEILNSSKDIMARVFNARINLQDYSTDDLVAYGKCYARELEYVIDDMGVLALYRRIGDLQTLDHNVTLEEVCEIIDNAIKHVDKKNMSHFMDVLLAKRYDDNDFIILREKDFIQ